MVDSLRERLEEDLRAGDSAEGGGKGTTQLKFLTVGSLKLLPLCIVCRAPCQRLRVRRARLPPSPATLYTLNSSLTLILEDERSQPHLTD